LTKIKGKETSFLAKIKPELKNTHYIWIHLATNFMDYHEFSLVLNRVNRG